MTDLDVDALHKRSSHHRLEILEASAVGCFFCLRIFRGEEVTDWTDDGETALCPHCDVDALLPSVGDPAILSAMHERWFTRRTIELCGAKMGSAECHEPKGHSGPHLFEEDFL